MSKLKRKLILLILLLLSILSVFIAFSTFNYAEAPNPLQVISRVGTVLYYPNIENEKYNIKKKVVMSSSGSGSGGGVFSWDDVVAKPSLLCDEEFGPIPGRTFMDPEKTLDWKFKAIDGRPGDLSFIDAEAYKDLLRSGDISKVPTGSVYYGKDAWIKAFGFDLGSFAALQQGSHPDIGLRQWRNNSFWRSIKTTRQSLCKSHFCYI